MQNKVDINIMLFSVTITNHNPTPNPVCSLWELFLTGATLIL